MNARINEDLIDLQREQLAHDLAAHTDILQLPVARRITHMTLHFAKYVGTLASELDNDRLASLLVDAFIIALASANALNIDLGRRIGAREDTSGRGLPPEGTKLQRNVFLSLAEATGRMAKACESLDHLEQFDYRGTMERQVVEIAALLIDALVTLDVDVNASLRTRWTGVERKSIFYQDRQDEPAPRGQPLREVC